MGRAGFLKPRVNVPTDHQIDFRRRGVMNQIIQDSVSIEVSVEESIVSDTVKVSMEVVLATKAEDATDVRGTILTGLKAVLDVDWAFTRLDRNTDRSGLEFVEATATARVPEGQLAGLDAKSKSASREGFQVTVGELDYNPARNVIDATVVELRKRIYAKAQEEANTLNELIANDTNGKWRVAGVHFGHGGPRMKTANSRMMLESAMPAAASYGDMGGGGESLDLTQKVGLTATVSLQRVVL